ncbi:MAG TPA: serine/threonine-protein kinase, partial [Kofleriaceae bacterium]|nr:serine/threonine-protein kinase [Kofleriaceae bacterium]
MRSVGNYVLGAQIGSGASSDVFAAQHRFLGDPVAIKLLRAEVAGAGAISEVVAEAAKLRAVQHPSVVRVLDVGRDEASGRCYLVMEHVDGESLAARLDREARLPEDLARRLGAEIADGLAAVHAAGLVHRDLKPGNVMLDGARAKLVDFGIAKFLGGDTARETMRRVGTPAYMAPEQLVGGLISPAVDVWALGVVLFRAVTGALPFEGFADGRCPQLVEDAPRASALAPVSPALDRLIAWCLDRDPGRRPPSMAAIARALRGEADGELAGERITEDAGPLLAAPPAPVPPLAAPYARPSPSPLPPSSPLPPPAVQASPEPSRRRRPLVMAAAAVAASVIGVSAAALVTRGSGGAAPSPLVKVTAEAAAPDPGSAAPDPRSATGGTGSAAPDPRSAAGGTGSAAPD